MGAYFAANYFINMTKDSINEDGELVMAQDGPGTRARQTTAMKEK